jgi:hypothetical protein
MRILRIAAFVVLVVAVLLGGAAAALLLNQDRIMERVLDGVHERTGYHIVAAATHIRLGSHLILEFDHPHVSRDGRELAKLDALRAVISYHSILVGGGVPLYSLVLVRPEFQLPARAGFAAVMPLPRVGTELVDTIIKLLNGLERAAWRVETIDATIHDTEGRVLFDRLGVLAFRRHRQPDIWRAAFSVRIVQPPFDGLGSTGRIRVGARQNSPGHQIAAVSVYFWNDKPNRLDLSTAHLKGHFSGRASFSLSEDGSASGSINLGVVGLVVGAKGSGAPESLGDFSLDASFSETAEAMKIERFSLLYEQRVLASGDAALTGLSNQKPVLTVHMRAGAPLEVATIRSHLRYFRNVPESVVTALGHIQSGRLLFNEVVLATTPEKLMSHPDAAIRDGIDISAALKDVSISLPDDFRLPMVRGVNAQIRYAHNTMSATRGSAALDDSLLSDVSARVDFARKFDAVAYELSLKGEASLAQLYPAISRAMKRLRVEAGRQITSLGGKVTIEASASGAFRLVNPLLPTSYRVYAGANRAVFETKGAPGPVELTSGSVTLEPGVLRFNRVALKTTGGNGIVDGSLSVDRSGLRVRDVTVELHDMPAGLWLALAVDRDSLQVDGPIGGKVRVRADPARAGGLLANGRLVVSTGSVQFGFLRSPMKIQGATISLDGRSVAVAMPSSVLEGSPLDFRMSVQDMGDPTLRIDANVDRLDFEVMKFIRLPWTPSTPPVSFPLPVKGHIEARRGNLSKLVMRSIKTDFWRIKGDWKVYNFTANAFNGSANLEISGRAKDDWISMQGKLSDMDVAPMFLMSGERKESPILGKIWVAADLSADTNNDFFETLGGRASITIRDGTLNRFKLLSRMLGMIDLKSWLTAQIPDPTVAGLPFETIMLDLKGDRGVFTTDDFVLDGPVMLITADGEINLAESSMDMRLQAFPLSSFNWLMSKIPVIGSNIAGSAGTVIGATFHAEGPVADPSVTPMPITSVAELVKKLLGLPINVIRPNTIK